MRACLIRGGYICLDSCSRDHARAWRHTVRGESLCLKKEIKVELPAGIGGEAVP